MGRTFLKVISNNVLFWKCWYFRNFDIPWILIFFQCFNITLKRQNTTFSKGSQMLIFYKMSILSYIWAKNYFFEISNFWTCGKKLFFKGLKRKVPFPWILILLELWAKNDFWEVILKKLYFPWNVDIYRYSFIDIQGDIQKL